MADSRSDGPLLPLHKMSSFPSNNPLPPPYSPSPSLDLDPSSPLKPSHLAASDEQRYQNNRRKAMICIFLAVMLLIVVPLAVFSVIISKAHLKEGCTMNDGSIMGGGAVCE
ncbi:hypothetical protein BKA65DRAFT_540048 [Rhexocercosporidium sp. MPI-PUGE-AT-0058]|nr:hypothetical protein BKA65DRAFT_540048 [Rhexocercosporidium sp. MPI-PUGE-AT-0058]